MNPSDKTSNNTRPAQTKTPGGTNENPPVGNLPPDFTMTGQGGSQPVFQPPPPSQQIVPSSKKTVQQPAAQQGAGKEPKTKANPNSTQNMLQIAEIRDGVAIMNDGSFRSVIMAKSINFDLMSPAEREGVEFGFQSFLNSLYFPIQIFVRSERVDIAPYIDKLDKIRSEQDNMLLALMMEDYIAYIDMMASQSNIMDKKFYVVIPFFPRIEKQHALTSSKNLLGGMLGMFSKGTGRVVINEKDLEDAKTELRNRVQQVLAGLLDCGVKALPLDTQELIELYYDTYNPDTATRQELKNFDDLSAPVITKGEGQAPQPNLDKDIG